jgi:hypothetical protein
MSENENSRPQPVAAWFALAALAALALSCSVGCRGSDRPGKDYKFSPVKGRVLAGDAPLTKGTVEFSPIDDPNFVSTGELQPDGSFTLTTRMPGKTASGAPEGDYRVRINVPPEPGSTRPPNPIGINETYTVKPGENDFTIQTAR